MKLRAVILLAIGFMVGGLVFSIPSVSRTTGDIARYFLSGDLGEEPLPGGGISVSWDDAEKLLHEGHVRSVMIPHSGRIVMKLDNGVRVESQQPHTGAALRALRNAPNRSNCSTPLR